MARSVAQRDLPVAISMSASPMQTAAGGIQIKSGILVFGRLRMVE